MTNPGNNPFPPVYATPADIANLQSQIDENSEHLTLLGTFYVHKPGGSIGTAFETMTQGFGDTSSNSFQSTVMRLQPCIIKKVYLSTNAGGEWTGGSLEWDLFKNAVRTGTPAYSSGPLLNNLVNFDYLTDFQTAKWDTANITMTEDDYLTARLAAVSVTGGPEGIYMQLWGSRL